MRGETGMGWKRDGYAYGVFSRPLGLQPSISEAETVVWEAEDSGVPWIMRVSQMIRRYMPKRTDRGIFLCLNLGGERGFLWRSTTLMILSCFFELSPIWLAGVYLIYVASLFVLMLLRFFGFWAAVAEPTSAARAAFVFSAVSLIWSSLGRAKLISPASARSRNGISDLNEAWTMRPSACPWLTLSIERAFVGSGFSEAYLSRDSIISHFAFSVYVYRKGIACFRPLFPHCKGVLGNWNLRVGTPILKVFFCSRPPPGTLTVRWWSGSP